MAAAEEPIVNTPFPDSWLPIHYLSALGDADALESDLSPNPALPRLVNTPTLGGGLTPLALAAEKGKTAAMAWLLRHGADPRAANDDGLAPLALAARAGHVKVVQQLLAHAATATAAAAAAEGGAASSAALLGQADRWGRVPLVIAVAHGRAEAFTCLLDALLAQAASAQDKEGVLEGLYSTGEGNGETTLLLHACRFGHAALVRALLTRGADPRHGQGALTPMAAATAAGSGPCQELLKEWERIYELAKARAVDDAQHAAAYSSTNARAGPARPVSPSLDVATQERTGMVAVQAVRAMADDTFAALIGMLGGRTTGEAVEDAMEEGAKEDEQGDKEMEANGGENGEEGPWDW